MKLRILLLQVSFINSDVSSRLSDPSLFLSRKYQMVIPRDKSCHPEDITHFCTDIRKTCPKALQQGSVCKKRKQKDFIEELRNSKNPVGPYQQCLETQICVLDFQRICLDLELKNCICAPPDAYRIFAHSERACKKIDKSPGCDDDNKYCRTNEKGEVECAPKLYYSSAKKDLGQYYQCAGGNIKASCKHPLQCRKFTADYSACLLPE